MKKLNSVWLAAAGVLLVGSNAMAEQLCNQNVHQKFEEARIYSRSFIAACKPGSQCRIVTHKLDKHAPLGFSHTLAFQRADVSGKWHLMLVDVLQLANVDAGFSMTVDRNPALEISNNLITAPVSVNEYKIDGDLSVEVLARAKPGDNIYWRYTTQDGTASTVRFSLSGLTKALKWAECAQAELASGKSGPPAPDDKKPEYSPPEPDVPVDPIGDGRD